MAGPAIGYGSTLAVGDGADPEVFTPIIRLTEIAGPEMEADDVEITAYDSAGGVKEYIRGLTDPGEISFTGIFVGDSTQTDLMDDLLTGPNQGNKNYQLTLANDNGSFDFSGYVKAFGVNPQLADRMEFSGAIKINGLPTFTAAT